MSWEREITEQGTVLTDNKTGESFIYPGFDQEYWNFLDFYIRLDTRRNIRESVDKWPESIEFSERHNEQGDLLIDMKVSGEPLQAGLKVFSEEMRKLALDIEMNPDNPEDPFQYIYLSGERLMEPFVRYYLEGESAVINRELLSVRPKTS